MLVVMEVRWRNPGFARVVDVLTNAYLRNGTLRVTATRLESVSGLIPSCLNYGYSLLDTFYSICGCTDTTSHFICESGDEIVTMLTGVTLSSGHR